MRFFVQYTPLYERTWYTWKSNGTTILRTSFPVNIWTLLIPQTTWLWSRNAYLAVRLVELICTGQSSGSLLEICSCGTTPSTLVNGTHVWQRETTTIAWITSYQSHMASRARPCTPTAVSSSANMKIRMDTVYAIIESWKIGERLGKNGGVKGGEICRGMLVSHWYKEMTSE